MEKAYIKYSNGWQLLVPRYGLAPMLFLEWLSGFRAGRNWIHKVHSNGEAWFSVQLNMTKEQLGEAMKYINNNLPVS